MRFTRASVGLRASGARLARAPVPVSFGGARRVTAPAGQDVLSDPVAFDYAAGADVAVSTAVAGAIGQPTEHWTGRRLSWTTPNGAGDHADDVAAAAYDRSNTTRPLVAGLEVERDGPFGAVVAFGDSLTDGYQGVGVMEAEEGIDANGRYPDVLGRRLATAGLPLTAVNAGISGNQVLADGGPHGGPGALDRLQTDVLDQPGVTTVIWLEGIDDGDAGATAAQPGAGFTDGIRRLHAAGLRVLQGTITPAGGLDTPSEAQRVATNARIREQSPADGVRDFDAAVRDPLRPNRLAVQYDGGDLVHLNLAGYRRMAEEVDLAQLAGPGCPAAADAAGPPAAPPAAPALVLRATPRRLVAGRRAAVRVQVTAAGAPVPAARVRLLGHQARTGAAGTARLRLRPGRTGVALVRVRAADGRTARLRLRVHRRP